MPASEGSLALTDTYRDRLLAIRQAVGRTVRGSWASLDLADLDGSYAAWLSAAAPMLAGAQAAAVTLSDVYLASFVRSETGHQVAPLGLDTDAFTGRDQFDRPLERSLTPPLHTVKIALAQRRGAEAALAMGLARALRIAAGATLHAPRAALSAGIAERPETVGWRRVTGSNPCGACLAAATGAIHDSAETLTPHDHCRCTKEPVVRGVRERHLRPTGAELFAGMTAAQQDALFHGRGGEEKAELVRSGQIELSDLITRQELALGGEVITETPLAALAQR